MRKLFKFLTLFMFAVAGLAFLTGSADSVSAVSTYAGAGVITIDISKEESGVVLLDQDNNGLTVRMDIGKIEFIPVSTPEGSFILPRIDGFTRSFKVGEPCLPLAARLLTIPFGCKLKAKVIDYKTEEINLADYNLTAPFIPVQPPLSKSQQPESVEFEYNRAAYSVTGKYSLPLAKAEILGMMRGTRLGSISISPLEYYPTENRITVYKSVTVRVKYENPDWELTGKMQKRYASPFFEPVNRQLLNYEMNYSIESDLVKYPIKYAIVSDRMFESQLQPFIQWKTKKGYKVVTGYTDVIGSTTTAIKSWLQNLYNAGTPEDPAPSFVLFVGDAQQIPAWSGSAGSHITDLKYCEFTGDNFPEIYYGRFSAQNTTQLQPQIDKTLEYEQYTMPDPGYLAEVTLVSGVDANYAALYGNGQINYGTTQYFNAAHGIYPNVWLYPDSDLPSARSDIIQTVNTGIGFYNYTAHCSHDGPSDPTFYQTDIANLTNIHKYLLGIGNCCLSNTFGTNYSTPCFGEAWLQAENKGGIGWIGGTNSTYWDEDYWWGVGNGPIVSEGPTYEQTGIGAYDGVFHDHGEPVTLHYTTNAAIIFAGNMAVTEAGSNMTTYYWEIYHLMGDPALMTYLWVPTANNVSHPSSVNIDATSITVQAEPGSYAGITKDGVLHGAGYIDSSGSANISLTPFGSTGTAIIVVTCQNKVPYESSINVIEGTSPPVADFIGVPTSGVVPLTVNFTDQSTGATSWSWDFGDTGTSEEQHPTHEYTSVGTYTVSLTVTNAYGSDTMTRIDYIDVTVLQPPVADFSADNTNIETGQSVNFTDLSTNNPTSWSWTFEGGTPGSSMAQNPTITYDTPGTYTVSLTASNAAGSDTETKVGYITVSSCIGTITNPGFETGNTSGWSATGNVSITTAAHSGAYAVSLDAYGARLEQVVTGLCPNTTYTVSAWGIAKSPGGIYLGVSNYGGSEETVQFVDSKNWQQQSITFTTGATNTSVMIFFTKTGTTKFTGSGDDFTLVKN